MTPAPASARFPAIILAGGRSSRMGSNKALQPLAGKTLIERVIERLAPQVSTLVINALPGWAEGLGLPVIPDTLADHAGPLAGIAAGLRHTQRHMPGATHLLSVPADSPFFPHGVAAALTSALRAPGEIAIAASGGHPHPVFGLWPVSITADLEQWLRDPENRRVRAFLSRHTTHEVAFAMIDTPDGPLDPFFNINTPDDLVRAEDHWKAIAP